MPVDQYRRRARAASRIGLALLAATLCCAAAPAAQRGLESLTLEELMQVDVTTVSGVAQERFTSPAAVYVITPEDLRRTGHRTLAEALRLVPGMFVGRAATSNWVVGARGLTGNSLTTTRSLVLIDGRVAYDPLINGSPWDVLDIGLDDVDRIEVIRGPGATLWGVNAVNGVINVITKSARDTVGTHARITAGTTDEIDATVRHGGPLGRTGAYRLWGRYADTPAFDLAAGGSAHDQWTRTRAGIRLDFARESGTEWMVQAGAYRHPTQRVAVRQPVPDAHLRFDQFVTDDDIDGGHLLVRASSGVGAPRGWSAHAYYDLANRHTSRIGIRRDTVDLDFRTWSEWGARQELVWGLEVFATEDDIENGPTFIFDPTSRSWTAVNGFVQNTTVLVPDRFYLMAGTKLTHHDFVGLEAQPSVRLWWTPSDRQTWWAGVSRPVRVPSRLEEEGLIVVAYADPGILAGGPPTGAVPFGVGPDPDLDAEDVLAYELGHRIRPSPEWEIDTALFFNDFSTLIAIQSPILPWSDQGTAEVYGAEVASWWRPSGRFWLEASYSFLDVAIEGPVQPSEEDSVPRNLAQLRASFDVTDEIGIHGALYYVDRLRQQGIDDYERLDLGASWVPQDGLEVALWGQNLLDAEHAETSAVAIPRGVHLTLTLDL
jgi:iron complex outermembrane receptor protein